MKKYIYIVITLALIFSGKAQAQSLGPSLDNVLASTGGPILYPAPGTYSTAQNITITCPAGKSAFYTTDGSTVTPAGTLYQSPISLSTNTTLQVLCVTAPAVQQNTNASSLGSACHIATAGTTNFPGPPPTTCTYSGGVSGNPSNIAWSFGVPATEMIKAPASSGTEVQALFTYLYGGNAAPSQPTCDSCKEITQDFWFMTDSDNTIVDEFESDMPQYDVTHHVNRQNGFQCNQKPGTLQWQVDSGNAGGWTSTGIPCNITPNVWHHLVIDVTWNPTDTGCGGQGCAHYQYMIYDGVYHALGGTYSNTQGYGTNATSTAWGRQDQQDLKATTTSSTTANKYVKNANVTLSMNDESQIVTAAYNFVSNQVAAPSFSVASGQLTPGEVVKATDALTNSTVGATTYYCIDCGSETPSYDHTTYLAMGHSHVFGHPGNYGLLAAIANATAPNNQFVTAFNAYGPHTIQIMAAMPGMVDSSVVTATYTVTPPTGTVISSCGLLPSGAGTFYLTANLSCAGNGIILNGNNQIVNLNGYTLTYGTGQSNQASGSDLVATSGSAVVTSASGSFTSALIGLRFFGDNYNAGGYQNFSNNTTVVSVQSATQLTLSQTASFTSTTGSPGEYFIAQNPVYGVVCDQSTKINGGTCTGSSIVNGTITQSTNASPNSNAIQFIVPFGYGSMGSNLVSDITCNIYEPEAECIDQNNPPTTQVTTFKYITVNDNVTAIYYRDGLPYPIKIDGHSSVPNSSIQQMHDITINGSPQGGIYAGLTTNAVNFYDNHSANVQYSNSFSAFSDAQYNEFLGGTILGYTQGIESEGTNLQAIDNYIATSSLANVHDPGHNPDGCNQNFAFRTKDFSTTGGSLTGNVINSNWINSGSGSCGAAALQFSILWTGDTTTVENNYITMNVNVPFSSTTQSSVYSFDGGPNGINSNGSTNGTGNSDGSGITFTNNTFSFTGAYASQGVQVQIEYDGARNINIAGLNNPTIFYWSGNVPSSATLTGTGSTTSIYCLNNTPYYITYNGVSVRCAGPTNPPVQLLAPVANLASGTYTGAQTTYIGSPNYIATICYTTDGTTPTATTAGSCTHGTQYTPTYATPTPLSIPSSMTLKLLATDPTQPVAANSPVATYSYTIN